MSKHSQEITASAKALKEFTDKEGNIEDPLKLLGFCMSLLPIPLIQQAGAAIDKHRSDKDLQKKLKKIWSEILSINQELEKISDFEDSIAEVAATVEGHSELLRQCRELSELLEGKESLFSIQTDDESYQELVRSLITADKVQISARNKSTNVVEDSEVRSKKTELHASGGSRNYFDNANFTDGSGSVGMRGVSTTGDVQVSGSTLSIMGGGTVHIGGGNPNTASGPCPNCHTQLTIDIRKVQGFTRIRCPSCFSEFPYKIN